jgi:hypothetical protein
VTLAVVAWPEVVGALATLVGSIGVVAALIYAARQTRSVSDQTRLQREEAERDGELQRAKLELRLLELTMGMDEVFLRRPALRPYFYENRSLSIWALPRRRAEVTSVAEMMIDFVDAIAGLRRHGQITDRNYANWRIFTQSYYEQSPTIRALWEEWGDYFLPETSDLFCGQARVGQLHADVAPTRGWTPWPHLTDRLRVRLPSFSPNQQPQHQSSAEPFRGSEHQET